MDSNAITKMFKDTYRDGVGAKALSHMRKTFVNRPIYRKGMTIDEVAYRQGQADLVKQIIAEVNKDG